MMGYLGNLEQTKEAIDEEGWMHTGELGKFDEVKCVPFSSQAYVYMYVCTAVSPFPISIFLLTCTCTCF